MSRKTVFIFLAALTLNWIDFAAAQQAKVRKIGWLGTRSASGQDSGSEVIRRELRELGYVEGKNLAFEYRYTEGKLDRLPALTDDLVRLNVDVILTYSTPATRAAKNATRTIPIVFLIAGDPVVDGLIDSLARPGENITGFTTISPVLIGKRLELLKETVTKLSRVSVLWSRQGSAQQGKESQLPATRTGSAALFYGGQQRRQIRQRVRRGT